MIKKLLAATTIGAALFVGSMATAQPPKENVSKGLHPNLAAAQRLARQAFNKVTAAQEANEWDLDGHARKAKELLDQFNNELKLAAEASNRNRRK